MRAAFLCLALAASDELLRQARYWLLAELLPILPQELKDELHAEQEEKTQRLQQAALRFDHMRGTNSTRFTQMEATLHEGRMDPERLVKSSGPYDVAELIRVVTPAIRDTADIVSLKIVNAVSGKEQLFLCIDSGEILLFSLNRNFDGLSAGAANEVLPPEMIFGKGSCGGDVNFFCRVADVDAADDGIVVVDRHRVIHLDYDWFTSGYDQTVTLNSERRFGKLNQKVAGTNGFFYPSAVSSYSPWNSTHMSADVPWTEVMLHGLDHFVFVSDTANHRVMVLKSTKNGFSYTTHFGNDEPDSGAEGLDAPLGIAIYKPSWEFTYEPIYANIFVADSNNHRIVKLDFGYPLSYNRSYGDVNDTYSWKFWEYQPENEPTDEIHLKYSGAFGGEGPGDPVVGRLVKPVGICTYRHFLFVVEERPEYLDAQRIVVLRVNPSDTSSILYVTEFYPEKDILLTGSISAGRPPDGALWYSYRKDLVNMYIGVAEIPVQLRRDPTPSPYLDWMQKCVNRTFYEKLVDFESEGRLEWEKVMSENILRAGLYYWPYFTEHSTEHGADESTHNLTNPMDFWDIDAFNGTLHNLSSPFNFELFEQVLFAGGEMTFCEEIAVTESIATTTGTFKKLSSPVFGAASSVFSYIALVSLI